MHMVLHLGRNLMVSSDEIYEVEDNPIMSLYGKDANKATLVA